VWQAFGARGEICFRALRPLAPDDAVTIGYIDLAGGLATRRAALHTSYLFE
jgi:hypothetical protein